VLIAAAIAIPVLLIVLGGDEEGTAATTSTTGPLATTTAGATSTVAPTTTAAVTTTMAPTTTTSADSPCGDPALDGLYFDCADGDMQACDDLYMDSPVGSECEAFADTCGGTTSGGTWCADGDTTTTAGEGDILDYTLPAVFAENVELSVGFTPDPIGWEVEAGGPIDAGVLDELECDGYTTAAPSVEVNYSGGTSTLLRFYFVADNPGDDTLLVVSDRYGNWVCNDDYDYGAGIVDPLVDITMAEEGTYDIWVTTYHGGESIPGTLYVTEVDLNHP
jgi:hypothetical protein